MPLIKNSGYRRPYYLFSKHIETILPALFRKVGNVFYKRERVTTPDGDFLDLDWSETGGRRLAVVSHGLEGDSQRSYILGMVKTLNLHGWDALAWNYRGCSGEMNRMYRFYHSGETKDLDFVLQYVLGKNKYDTVVLIGFSVGGNITLKYLGEKGAEIAPEIDCAVTFSVPCHLESTAYHLEKRFNKVYLHRFLKSLRTKILSKAAMMPDVVDVHGLEEISSFLEFDEKYTAPMNGFKSAQEYWKHSSSLFYLHGIRIPTLLVNALNDPFLTPQCYPVKEAEANPCFFLEMPETGGHVGFFERDPRGLYWSEKRAMEFIKNHT